MGRLLILTTFLATWPAIGPAHAAAHTALRVLFLGDNGPHRPADRFKQLQPVLAERGIELEYTDRLDDLEPAKLAGYDALAIFANQTEITPAQETALLEYVAGGGGLVPLHCASYCFLNSPKYIALVGGQFKSHGAGVFKETIVRGDHPVMKGLAPIESWDETYVHAHHNPDRVILAERRDAQGTEPYTWVRTHGRGRVFYTAWGHDQRTWSNPGFHALVENGIRWASANSATRLEPRIGPKPFQYVDAPSPLPNYVPDARWGTQAEPIRTMQKALSPEESFQRMVAFPEFAIGLFAAEPDIVKPIWLSWDERGRLWIAETVDYPNEMQAPGEGRDRIKICEDTNGDGRADRFTVFADRLSVPTGFVFANGGVIVVHSGKTELFKDTNGDDKADARQVLFSGWGTADTHAGPSNLRFGFDNWIWGVVGYSGFQGKVGGRELRFGQGIYRFKPDGSQLEFIRSSNNNTWGLGLSEDGVVFGSTANGNASMYMPIANRHYEAVSGWSASRLESIADSQRFYPITDKIRQVDWHGKYTAGSGGALYTARSFPKEYWNRVQFVAEPTGHLLGKFHIEPRGADFVAHNGRNFLASDDEWTSPIAAEVGPDGALWVIDWYNYIIQHNPTPNGFQNGRGNAYETPLRDKVHGRIYRVTHTAGRRTAAPARLDKAGSAELVAVLKNDNLLWRSHAQRLLVERGSKDAVPMLCDLVRDPSQDEIGLNPGAFHALWTLHGLGVLEGADATALEAATGALQHPAAAVRRAAVQVLPRTGATGDAVLGANLMSDSDAQVRLAALLALSDVPPVEGAGEGILAMLQEPRNAQDRWIPDAATSAAARNDAGFLKAALASFAPVPGAAAPESKANLVPNGSFEEEREGNPAGWRRAQYGGRAELTWETSGRNGGRAVRIRSEQGADAGWAVRIPVKRRTEYQLSGWIRTEGLQKAGGGLGALFNIHELQDAQKGATRALSGDTDWTQVQLTFNSGDLTEITVNCLFGGWGRAKGTALFDDVELTPAPGSELAGEVGRVIRLVTTHYAQRGPVDSIIPTLVALRGASAALAIPVLDGLVSGWPQDRAPSIEPADAQTLTSLMESMPESLRDRLLALAQRWGRTDIFGANMGAIVGSLKQQVTNASLEEGQRVNAARRLLGLDAGAESVETVLSQIDLLSSPVLANGLVNALTQSRNPATGPALLAQWARFTPSVRRTAVAALLRRPDWSGALLTAVEKGAITRGDLAAEHWSQLKQSPNRELARRAERITAGTVAVSADRAEIVQKLLPLAKEKGNAARGREVYVANCAVCHLFNGQGGKVGPELSGIGARDRTDILLEVLDPNRSVEANYRLWTVMTKDGETLSGRLETETQTSVEILDTTGQKHVIQRRDIASLNGSALSIMPNGFEALPPDDLKSLIEYLAQPHRD